MTVQWHTLRAIDPFPSVEFDGVNFDEVFEFVQKHVGPDRLTIRNGVLVAHLRDDDRVVKPGWSVGVCGGFLTVTSTRRRELEWDRADAPDAAV